MISFDDAKRKSGLWVIANTWFLFLGQACVFPHLTRYYDLDLHLNDWQIGLIMSCMSLAAVSVQPLWGVLADRVLGRTVTLRIAVGFNIVFLFLFAFSYQVGGYAFLLVAGMLFFTTYSASIPLNSAIILSYLGKKKRHLFGRIRVFGSISFMVGMFCICPLMVHLSTRLGLYGRTLVFMTACGMYLLTLLTTLWDESHFERHAKPEFASFLTLFRDRNFWVFYGSIFFVSVGASAGIQYIGPYIGHRGLSERFFSTLWLAGVSMEIVLTFFLHYLVRTLGLKTTVVMGFAAEFVRWLGLSLMDAPGWILFFSLLHGPAVLGVFFASAMYLDAKCEESVRSTAQAMLYFSFIAGQVSGYLMASALVNHYSYLARAEAIQASFTWFSLFALLAFLFAVLLLQRADSDPIR